MGNGIEAPSSSSLPLFLISVLTGREGRERFVTALSPPLLKPEVLLRALEYLGDTRGQCHHNEFLFENPLLGSSPARGCSCISSLISPASFLQGFEL